jgi:hypothetical protein
MNRLVRRLIWIGSSAIFVISLSAIVLYRIGTGIPASVEHKSAKYGTATVVSATEIPRADSSGAKSSDRLFRVCFTIDNFDQIEADMRQGYQSAEAQRLAQDGPRCTVTGKATLVERLSKGDKLSVVYLLENEYQIDLVRASASGEEL